MPTLKKLINDVEMAIFVKYYYVFKECDREKAIHSITETITDKSKGTRTSKAHKIFNDNLQVEVLRLICDSTRIDVSTLNAAEKILFAEMGDNK